MNKVLVLGADGFIGKHLVKKLLRQNKEVYAVVYPGNKLNIDDRNLCIVEMDLNGILNYCDKFPEDIEIMYLLAWKGVKPEQRNDLDLQMENINMSLECMKFATQKGIKKVVMPGSTNEYLYYGQPINKLAVACPSDTYGAVKVATRYLCSDFADKNNIEFIYAIITGIYADDRRDNNVIFYTIEQLLKRQKPILTKLEQKWDYVHIDDVTEAMYLIGEKGKNGAVYAIGHGDNWELSNYIRIIHKKIDETLSLGIGEIPYSKEVLPSSCIDLTDIQVDTGFVPGIDFETGISKVIDTIKYDLETKDEE